MLGAMDGTRDAEGLAAAAELRSFKVGVDEARAFVEDVERAGLLEGETTAQERSRALAPFVPGPRPLEVLPRFLLACDGSGSCCRLFPTIAFTARDVASARAVAPDVENGCHDEQRAFTPSQGSRHALSVVTLVDGRCGYLEGDGRCRIHAASDASFKPFGCRTFPLSFVDDGTSVRVVPRPECACVPRSDGGARGEPLLAEDVRTRADLAPEAFVHAVPDPVPVASGEVASREAFARWSRLVADIVTADAAAAFAGLAASLTERGLDEVADGALVAAPPPLPWDEICPRIERIRAGAAHRAADGFRSGRDLAHQSFVALETACDLVLAAPAGFIAGPRSAREAAAEGLHLRTMIFGHLVFHLDASCDLAEGLRALAARVVAARALGAVAELTALEDPAFRWPLSLVEALCRAYALEAPTPDGAA